jgi:hypothetical protein
MSDSKRHSIINYINDFATKSVSEFKWYYNDIYQKSVFATIVSLKSSRNVSPNYLSNADKILSGHSNLFKLIGMRFTKRVHDGAYLELILSVQVPSESPLFINIYTEVISSLLNDMTASLGKSHSDKTNTNINLVYEACLVYCYHFINCAAVNNLVDKVVEELYLLREIECFKNRKGE